MPSVRPATRLAAAAALAALPAAAVAGPFTATEMMRLKRLSEPQVSPDGTRVVFVQTEVDLAANAKQSDLWMVPVAGGEPRRLTGSPVSESRPRWSPDGRRIAFVAPSDGKPQIHLLDLAGGEPQAATAFAGGVSSVSWIDDGRLLVRAEVFPACGADDACNGERLEALERPSSARAYDSLLYRHWDTWEDGRREHLFAVTLADGQATDLTPGPDEVPPFSLGGPDGFAVSPDGQEVCFSRKEEKTAAWSTNGDVWVVPSAGGQPRRVAHGPGDEGGCQYSPDGRLLAWRMQERDGYESDRWQLLVMDRASGDVRNLTAGFDRQVDSFTFAPDSRTLYLTAEDQGQGRVFTVPVSGGAVTRVLEGGSFGDLSVLPGGKTIVATHTTFTQPTEIVRLGADGRAVARVTRVNDATLAPFRLRPGESVTYAGAGGQEVQAWVVKPPGFDPAKKYPLVVLIHGGPQGAWSNGWSYRWNPQAYAAAGYVVFMPNPTGSIGWGQAFTDAIRGDWGGKVYEDIMKGTDYAESLPYVDATRTVAAGASFGGYMVDWIAGHTDRFRALVTHDGVFDVVSMYGSTEELWFPEWDLEGTYWTNAETYARWNPRAFVTSFKTPTLVVHGERDYRVPVEQGLAMFTALQRQGVPSRLLVFPDENHWVLKPANSVRWHEEVLGWLDRWSRKEPRP
ncbi:MAG: S9 family peptidase [Acidobacteria bacterium]|nr:S9 family peptidase [Acidobacteriota bacterium]